MGYTFICSSQKPYDNRYLSLIRSCYLDPQGVDYWIAKHTSPLECEQIEERHQFLCAAERVLLTLSPESLTSAEARAEWQFALAVKMPVVLLYVKTCEVPEDLCHCEVFDFRTKNPRVLNDLIDHLKTPALMTQTMLDEAEAETWLKSDSWHIRLYALDWLVDNLPKGTLDKSLRCLFHDSNEIIQDMLVNLLPHMAQGFINARKSFRNANLKGVNLVGMNFSLANLSRTDLSQSDLRGVDFRVARLWGANLQGADLRVADLKLAKLWGANFCGCDLRGADLRLAKLWGARFDFSTRLPNSENWTFQTDMGMFTNPNHRHFWQAEWSKY